MAFHFGANQHVLFHTLLPSEGFVTPLTAVWLLSTVDYCMGFQKRFRTKLFAADIAIERRTLICI